MSQWYLSKNGKALGPLEADKIISLIQAKEIGHLDLVYKAGESEWLPLAEVEEFKNHLKAEPEPHPSESPQVAEWVLLKKVKGEKGSEYKQLGPFTEEQVLELVDRGDVKFTDFAWKKGLESWVRIAELESFAQPLPSSPKIDMSIYEKTTPDIPAETVSDANKASMTEMVKIERFDHEPTQMLVPKKQEAPEEIAENTMVDEDKTAITHSVGMDAESFATESTNDFLDGESATNFDVDLWSLEPPSQSGAKKTKSKEVNAKADSSETSESEPVVKVKAKKKKAPKEKPKKAKAQKPRKPRKPINPEVYLWGGAAAAFILSIYFVFASLTPDAEVTYEPVTEPSMARKIVEQQQTPPPPQPVEPQAIQKPEPQYDPEKVRKQMAALQKKIADARKIEEASKLELKQSKKKKTVAAKKVASPKPKDKLKKKAAKKPVVKKKVAKAKPKAKPKPKAKAKPKVVKKAKPKKVSKPKKKVVKKSTNVAVGSSKMRSYYKQRDRKALFYSSLKAETLAVDIERQYKKLRSSKSAWGRYYGQWKKRVRAALAKDIQNYPQRAQKYAYPKLIASFKKDYQLFYKYGENFNSKVTGRRLPSGAPANMRAVFAKYKKQAQGLGK